MVPSRVCEQIGSIGDGPNWIGPISGGPKSVLGARDPSDHGNMYIESKNR